MIEQLGLARIRQINITISAFTLVATAFVLGLMQANGTRLHLSLFDAACVGFVLVVTFGNLVIQVWGPAGASRTAVARELARD